MSTKRCSGCGWTAARCSMNCRRNAQAGCAGPGAGRRARTAAARRATNHLDIAAIEWAQELLTSRRGAGEQVQRPLARWSGYRTTAPSSTPWRRASSSSTAASAQLPAVLRLRNTKLRELENEASGHRARRQAAGAGRSWVRKVSSAAHTQRRPRPAPADLRRQRATRRANWARCGWNSTPVCRRQDRRRAEERLDAFPSISNERTLIDNFSATILRGDKVGLIWPPTAAQDDAAQLILGELAADSGSVRQGTRLQVAYFDQMRVALDLTRRWPTRSARAANGSSSAMSPRSRANT